MKLLDQVRIRSLTAITVLNLLFLSPSFAQEPGFHILGLLSNIPDSTLFYLENLNTGEPLDSAYCLSGALSLKGALKETPEELWMTFKANGKRNYLHLLIGNESVKMLGDISDFPALTQITGSDHQEELNEITAVTAPFVLERDSLAHHFFQLSQDERKDQSEAIWGRIAELDELSNLARLNYIVSHPNAYPSAIHLDYMKTNMSKDSLADIFKSFTPKIQESRFARPIKVYLENRIAKEGQQYHDFEALNPDSALIRFSDLMGTYTLLEFNSVFCGFCRPAKNELLAYYDDNPDSLVIVSFSVDPQRSDWIRGLKNDPVPWQTLWDGDGQFSETAIKYGVNGLPAFILIDSEGKILKKWSGYRKGTLRKKLSAILNE